VWRLLFFRVLFGERSQGALRPATRLSPTVCIEHEAGLALDDEVFIGHFCFIEASAGVRIGRGTHITNFVSIVSHSTARAARVAAQLSGAELGACRTWIADSENRPQRAQFSPDSPPHSPALGQEAGEKWAAAVDLQPATSKSGRLLYSGAVLRAPVVIGQRCFIGPHSTIEAGAVLGHGTLVAAHSRVRGTYPDFAVLSGSPAQVVGDTRMADERWLADHPALLADYRRWRESVVPEQGATS
jgi:acetyltransferase-like isoleucine patch superfamily enzyme